MSDPQPIAQAIWVAACFAIAFAGTWVARRYALGRQLLDLPGDRRSHTRPTPRGGGVAIVVAMLVALAILCWIQRQETRSLVSIAIGLCLVGGVGWADDHRPLSPLSRLAVQALACLFLAAAAWMASDNVLVAGMAWLVGMVLVNVWNFMDGIDGLAASQALLVALVYRLLAPGDAGWMALALVGACAGFLPFNVPRARIFLGDVGSGALGFLLAALLVRQAVRTEPTRVSTWGLLLLPASAFLIDAALTLLARMVSGQRWWLPHVEHAYQHWARHLRRHGPVTLAYAGWTLLASALMLFARASGPLFMMFAFALTGLAGFSAWSVLRRDRWIERKHME